VTQIPKLPARSSFRDRLPDAQTAKTVVAAVVAYAVAAGFTRSSSTLIAPLTALLVTQVTVFETLTTSTRRVVAVVSGVLLALLLSGFAQLHWWSLAVVLVASFTIGAVLRLEDHSTEVAISAMLVFAVGGSHATANARVVETLIGAAVGIAFNLVIAPTRVEPAGAAIRGLADRTAQLLAATAADLRGDWSHERAARLLADARRLRHEVGRAEDTFADAERSLRFNPRGARLRANAPSLRAALAALEHVSVSVRSLARVLADRTDDDVTNLRTLGPGDGGRQALSVLLGHLSDAVRAFATLAVDDVRAPTGGDDELLAILDRALETRRRLTDVLAVDAHDEPRLWTLHGTLLAAVDRMLRELDPRAGSEASNVPRSALPPTRWRRQQRVMARKALTGVVHVARVGGATTKRLGTSSHRPANAAAGRWRRSVRSR
jgi:hypothetical protein